MPKHCNVLCDFYCICSLLLQGHALSIHDTSHFPSFSSLSSLLSITWLVALSGDPGGLLNYLLNMLFLPLPRDPSWHTDRRRRMHAARIPHVRCFEYDACLHACLLCPPACHAGCGFVPSPDNGSTDVFLTVAQPSFYKPSTIFFIIHCSKLGKKSYLSS